MRPAETASLLSMAALWGGSFVFQRALVPVFGPIPLTFLRLAFAGSFLLIFAAVRGKRFPLKSRLGFLFGIGLLSSAVPYSLFAFGATKLSAALLGVLNATAPMFGALFAALWLRERLTALQATGLVVGAGGVAIVSEAWTANLRDGSTLAILACLLASACYGLSGIVMKLNAKGLGSLELATGGQVFGALALALPAAILWPRAAPVPPADFGLAAAFGAFCSALPFLVYTWLLARVGPTRALTVTFLIPLFGALWGWLLLHEPLHPVQFLGGGVILLGTYLVTRPSNSAAAQETLEKT
ncbi:MAG: DMT family transporter [Fimbriimonadaceae bacterium]|nr:DMT family transporter [Fimbriimonadaceae bacterium]QYK56270.1 MAG: DMT family transporter [Fimbriimonadaceae bacterium]